MAALAGALLCGACSKEPAPAPAPAAKPAPEARETEPAPEPAAEAEPEAQAQAEEAAPAAPVADTGPAPEFKIGQHRDEVMRLFGNCAERRVFVPGGPNGAQYVEVYQAKEDEACIKRLGDRHFLIRGDFLHEISPGRMVPPSFEPPPEGT
ncbi:hypothetical protein [Hyalangium rubrum]|uniref:Lipoprotein n=1 Tax=Hyalangium rubrum TaxID=3103134 RepID=A0ABU5H442_9BACT|nr:hypothetical protein [Hyalangium sp. s54d21]MDY7227654.1 hypothetical protein [Hyalangium sp. s54d21]